MIATIQQLAATSHASSKSAWDAAYFFAQPLWLWALLLLIPLLLLRHQKGSAASIKHPAIRLMKDKLKRPSTLAGKIGAIFASCAYACLIFTLAQPQMRQEFSEEKVSGIDIMIACDLSGSMGAKDMSFNFSDARGRTMRKTVDRLEAAKNVIEDFIEKRPNDRIGLIAFAGKAKLSCPLTLDHPMLNYVLHKFYLEDPYGRREGYIKEQGTAIGSAIASAATRLEEREGTKSKVIILVTDGQSNMGTITPLEAAKQAKELGIRIFTIAIGQRNQITHRISDDGVDEKTLREIAHLTDGRYFRASSGQGLMKAFEGIDQLEKTDAKRRTILKDEPLYTLPLTLALILASIAYALGCIRPRVSP